MKTFKQIYEAKRKSRKDALRDFLYDPDDEEKQKLVKDAFPSPKHTKKDKKNLRRVLKAGKTMTGKPSATIEINPKDQTMRDRHF